jgi:hypothetical protein
MILDLRVRAWLVSAALTFAIALAISITSAIADIMPPNTHWAMGFSACLSAIACAAAGYAIERTLRLRVIVILLCIAILVFVLTLGSYFGYSASVIWISPTGDRWVKGRELTADAKALKEKLGWDEETLLEKAPKYDLRFVYTAESISQNQRALMVRWMTAVTTLVFICALTEALVIKNLLSNRIPETDEGDEEMLIPGTTVEEICQAFEEAFDRDDLREMLRKRMSQKLDNMTGPNDTWKTMVFKVVEWSERRGKTTELIRVGYDYNPSHPAMQALYQKYGLTGVDLQQGGKPAEPFKATQGGFEKTIKAQIPQLDLTVWRTKLTQVEGRVCRIEIDGNPAGTGFLVGPDAVLTNYHVLEDVLTGNTPAAKVACRFDYKMLADKSKVEGVVVELHATEWNLDSSPFSPAEKTKHPDDPPPTADQLDYALVRLARRVGEETFSPKGGAEAQKRGWLTLPVGPLTFVKDMPLVIAQHPAGSPLKLAVDTESVIGEAGNGLRVRYRTNTEGGSSGSPVFDLSNDCNLLALHHLGDPASNLPRTYNQGIPLDKVRARLGKTPKAAAALG